MPGLSEKFVSEFEDLIKQRPYTGYGIDFQNKVQKKRAAKKQPEAGSLEFSLLPAAEPEVFTSDELYDLSTDPAFASATLESYTRKKPTAEQISQLQARVTEKYPNLSDQIAPRLESMADVQKRMINDLFTIHETGNVKPFVDLMLSYPGLSPRFSASAKKIKESGYKETLENKAAFDGLREQAESYSQHPGGKQALLSAAEEGHGFSGRFAPLMREMQGYVETPQEKQRRENDENILKNIKDLKAKNSERVKATPLRMKEARNIEEEVQSLKESSRRVAPLNEVHEQAKQLLNQNLNQDSLDTARREIAASQRMDIPREIEPHLRRATESPQQFIQDYEVNYGPVIEGYRQEARKDFLEHDLPQINNQFASKGAFFSGAREAALNKAIADKEARIEREISKLKVHGREEAMKHFHEHQGRHLKSAEIAGNARKAQKEGQIRGAEALRENALTGKAAALQDVSALSNIARTQQEQAQHELDVRMAEHKEFQERPYVELARKSALAQGHPLPSFQFSPIGLNPPAPNVYELGAGALGTAAGLHRMRHGQSQPYKKGGHVRTKHAHGDSIARHAAELKQMEKHYEDTPSADVNNESMRQAQATRHHAIDPEGSYLMTLGSHILANSGKGRAVQSYGEGTEKGMNAFNAAKIHNLDSKHKYINLINAINQSRMNQQGILSKYHVQRSQQEEQARAHNMQNAESSRYHNMMFERQTQKPLKISAADKKIENDARKDLLRAVRMKKEINGLEGLITQTDTGPVKGFLKSLAPKTKTDNKIEVTTNKLILDMHQGMKNIPRSEEFLKRIETTKPNRHNYLEANKQSLEMMNQGADDVMENGIATLLSAGWSPEKIERQFKIKIPRHLLEEGESEESDHPSTSEDSVKMQGPDGIEYAIPHSQVNAAIQDGGRVIG